MSQAIDPAIRDLNNCECCDGLSARTPVNITNRPGLAAVAYRVGTHAQFKHSMLAALSDRRRGALAAFNTRDNDDFTIALLDAWAITADVLAFYQERIANESYLRTATERRSVLELARTIGYELAPGVAASTWLAFTIESGNGAPRSVTGIPPQVIIPAGTHAQSIPGQDELPQDFETIEPVEARAEWNAMRARLAKAALPVAGMPLLYLKGTETGLFVGDTILVVAGERAGSAGNRNWDVRKVAGIRAVIGTDAVGYTVVTLDKPLGSGSSFTGPVAKGVKVYALRQRAALFGSNAPDWKQMPDDVRKGYLGISRATTTWTDPGEWPGFNLVGTCSPPPPPTTSGGLAGDYYNNQDFTDWRFSRIDPGVNFDWGLGSPDPRIDADTFSVRWSGWIQPKISGRHTFQTLSDDGIRLWVNDELVIDDWTVHSASTPKSGTATAPLHAGQKYSIRLEYFEQGGAASVKLWWSTPDMALEIIPADRMFTVSHIHLDTLYPKILPDSWIVLAAAGDMELYRVTTTAESSRTNFMLNTKTTLLGLEGINLISKFNNRLRETIVYAVSEPLEIADEPITTAVADDVIEIEGDLTALGKGRHLAFAGADDSTGAALNEVAMVMEILPKTGYTQVKLAKKLSGKFRRAGLLINANVAAATHGETKTEVLGSGDASRTFQRFTLRQNPLTYTAADNPTGGISTLQVRVNDVLWQEVPTLHGRGPREHIYITRADDKGNVTVIFGDGRTGARLPTGIENVTARYRMGIGKEGEVDAGQISLLMSPPLAVQGVINPLPATGAANPQLVQDTRENAPRTVLTLGRIVSLRDYEDFAGAFAGIGKAMAAWTWNRNKRGVLITVAGADGASVPEGEKLHTSLLNAIAAAGDPFVSVQVKSYRKVTFAIRGSVKVDALHIPEKVSLEIEKALRSRFSFSARSFGQSVHLSEVIAIIQRVRGVAFVDVDEIRRTDGADNKTPLAADSPRPGAAATAAAAELLTLHPGPLSELEVK